jgi:DNA repair exonuclease SbcCD ATPase subunit
VATEGETACQILLMDEVLDGLDVEGRRRVVQLLRELRSRKETVMVISHEADLLDEFEQVFLVSKRDGVSTFHAGGGGGDDEVP